ncbi:MAG: four helix bundle protein [Acidobacteriota bacterium]
MSIRSYRDLRVWRKGVYLAVTCYRLRSGFPRQEVYGLVGQIRRAAVSVPANIAEGHGREHLGDYLRFLSAAKGSLMELETHVIIAERLEYLSPAEAEQALSVAADIGRMLSGLIARLKSRSERTSPTGRRTPST